MCVAGDGLPFLLGEAGHSLLQPGAVVVVQVPVGNEQHLGLAVRQCPVQLPGLVERVEQHHQRPHAGRGQPGHHPLRPVRGQQRHPAARSHAARQQPPAEAAGLGLQVPIRETPLAQHHQIPVAPLLSQVAREPVGGGRIPRLLEPPPSRLVNAHSQSVEPAAAPAGPMILSERRCVASASPCGAVLPALVRCAHGPLGPRSIEICRETRHIGAIPGQI